MKRIIIAASSLALALGILTAPQALADYEANCSGNGTVVAGASMTYGGTTATATNNQPFFYVCRNTSNSYYTVMIGLYNQSNGKLVSDLGAANANTEFTVTFPVTAGDAITIADGVGSITGFTPSSSQVVVKIKPVKSSTVWQSARPTSPHDCKNGSISDSNGNYYAECAGTVASATEYVARFNVRYGAGTWTKLAGMYVSTSADLFQVELASACPTQSYSGGSSGDGGAYRPTLRATSEANLKVQMLGPHLAADGTTENQGNLTAVIPFATVQACLGATPMEMENSVSMTRTENGATEAGSLSAPTGGLKFTVTPSQAGLVVSVPTVTFSQPTYNLKFAKPGSANTGTTTDSASGGTTANTSASTGTIAGVKAKGAKGKASASFKKVSTVKSYAVEAQLSSGKGSTKKGKCSVKGPKVTCTVAKLKKGAWTLRITSTLTAGGAGPTATKPGIKVK